MNISPRTCFRSAIVGSSLLMIGCGGGNTTPRPAPNPVSPGNAFVYTANAGGNSISGFMNDSSGALTLLSGSPFSLPGQPWGIAATPNNKFLYVSSFQNAVVNSFAINPTTGGLTPLSCSAAATGLQPLKIAITPSGAFLYTANQGGNVSGFSIDSATGCLTAISSTPTDAVARGLTVERNGKFLYVVTGGGGINTFSIATDGTLTRLAAAGFDSGTTTMLAVKASPKLDILIATDAGSTNVFRTFTIDTTTGKITPFAISGSGTTPSAIAYNRLPDPSVTSVYVANTGSNNITLTSVDAQGEVFFFTSMVPDSTGPVDLDTDPAGKFIYIANNGSSDVTAFIPVPNAPLNSVSVPTGNGPQSIVVVGRP